MLTFRFHPMKELLACKKVVQIAVSIQCPWHETFPCHFTICVRVRLGIYLFLLKCALACCEERLGVVYAAQLIGFFDGRGDFREPWMMCICLRQCVFLMLSISKSGNTRVRCCIKGAPARGANLATKPLLV